MGDIKGFLKVKRQVSKCRPVCERVQDYREVGILPAVEHSMEQASRCMDCGTPFCLWGCPISNYIPEWNDLLFRGKWEKAYLLLSATNNFPEITGRICPALCEYACVLEINDEAVTTRENELAIIEYAFKHGFIKPNPPKRRTGKKVAIIGSGPAGLSCADQLNKAGHNVVVFERDDKIGGILRYGIPDFKLEKRILDRRLEILKKEGIKFMPGINVGMDLKAPYSRKEFDAICLACGSRIPRDLPPKADQPAAEKIEGRELKGIYFAMDYLIQSNKRAQGVKFSSDELIDAKDKKVVVIGGGDTGADCIGVAHRQGAKSVTQIEIMPRPAESRTRDYPWPKYPLLLKATTSHQEAGIRDWSVSTKKFIGENGHVKKLSCCRVEFKKNESGHSVMEEISGSEFELDGDLVILALGFLPPERNNLLKESFLTSRRGVFSCGDMRRGQSLIVWAISEGRRCADFMDKYLTQENNLPII